MVRMPEGYRGAVVKALVAYAHGQLTLGELYWRLNLLRRMAGLPNWSSLELARRADVARRLWG